MTTQRISEPEADKLLDSGLTFELLSTLQIADLRLLCDFKCIPTRCFKAVKKTRKQLINNLLSNVNHRYKLAERRREIRIAKRLDISGLI